MEVLSGITLEQARAVFPSLADHASMQSLAGDDLAYLDRLMQVHADLMRLDEDLRARLEVALARNDRFVADWRALLARHNDAPLPVAVAIERFVRWSGLAQALR